MYACKNVPLSIILIHDSHSLVAILRTNKAVRLSIVKHIRAQYFVSVL